MEYRTPGTRLRYLINDLLIRNPFWQMLVLVIASLATITIGFLLVDDSVEDGEVVSGWLTGTGSESRVYLNSDRNTLLPVGKDTRIVVIAER